MVYTGLALSATGIGAVIGGPLIGAGETVNITGTALVVTGNLLNEDYEKAAVEGIVTLVGGATGMCSWCCFAASWVTAW